VVNKETLIANNAKRHKIRRAIARSGALPAWLGPDELWLMEEAYSFAAEKTKITGIKWEVDHVYPLQGKVVSGLHVPSNLQIIPAKMNRQKGEKHPDAFSYTFLDYI